MRDILLLIKLGYGSDRCMKKKILYIILCFIAVSFVIMIAAFIHLWNIHGSFRDAHLSYVSSMKMKKEILRIHNYLKVNNYVDQFGYLNCQYRFDKKKQASILTHIYDEKLFNMPESRIFANEKFSPAEYIACLQTLIVLSNLLDSYGSLEMQNGSNAEKFQHMLYQLTIWVLNFPQGELIGRENILKNLCSKNFEYLHKK